MSTSVHARCIVLLLATSLSIGASLGLSSCEAPATHPDSAGRSAQPVLQFAAVAGADEKEGVTEYTFNDRTIRLRELWTFEIQGASPTHDSLGWPAIQFEIADGQKDEFRRWTAILVEHRLAILIDGVVVATPTVKSPLPGSGIIESGAAHWSEEEVKSLANRIRDQGTRAPEVNLAALTGAASRSTPRSTSSRP